MSQTIWIPVLLVALMAIMLQPRRAACQTAGDETSAPAQTPAQPLSPTPPQTSDQPSSSSPAPNSTQTPRLPRQYRRPSLDERVKRLAKGLDLTESQQAGVKAVLEGQQRRARQIQFNQSLSGADRIS